MNIIIHNILVYIQSIRLYLNVVIVCTCIMYNVYIYNKYTFEFKSSIHLKYLQFMEIYTFVQLLLFFFYMRLIE